MNFISRIIVAAFLVAEPTASYASGVSYPTINTTGNGQNQTPITAFQVPNNIPAADLPTPGGNAVSISAAVQSYAASQGTPTSPPPNCQEPPVSSQYQLNQYTWPTIAQSITWWETQPGIPAVGTYAYKVGTTTSHQDAEGWIGGCTADPQPCSTAAGWIPETWGGQFAGWQGSCQYVPPPSCSSLGVGYYGNYTWNTTTYAWVNTCSYAPKPACPPSGSSTGWISTYRWVYPNWAGSCTYVPPPACPAGYIDSYTWTGAAWAGACTQPPQPSCQAGYEGSYSWNSAGYWQNGCYIPPEPTCPSGYNQNYSWNGSAWVGSCVPAMSSCLITTMSGPSDSQANYGAAYSGYAINCNFLSYLQSVYPQAKNIYNIGGYTILDVVAASSDQAPREGSTAGYSVSFSVPSGTSSVAFNTTYNLSSGTIINGLGGVNYVGSATVGSVALNTAGTLGTGRSAVPGGCTKTTTYYNGSNSTYLPPGCH